MPEIQPGSKTDAAYVKNSNVRASVITHKLLVPSLNYVQIENEKLSVGGRKLQKEGAGRPEDGRASGSGEGGEMILGRLGWSGAQAWATTQEPDKIPTRKKYGIYRT